eukprot:1157863-Pelagomonas_calceolata.AAC.1
MKAFLLEGSIREALAIAFAPSTNFHPLAQGYGHAPSSRTRTPGGAKPTCGEGSSRAGVRTLSE